MNPIYSPWYSAVRNVFNTISEVLKTLSVLDAAQD